MKLKAWFDRFGVVDEYRGITFKRSVREVDPAVMEKVGRLHAGPLYARLSLSNVDEPTVEAVVQNRQGDEKYLALAKEVVKYAVPKLRRLITILRTVYGQYWLEEAPMWDSQSQSLGFYCWLFWQMQWSLDQSTWNPFEPDKRHHRAKGGTWELSGDGSCYITKEDWSKLVEIVRSDYVPSDAVEMCNRSRSLLENGHDRYAIIEAVSALEIAVLQYVERKCKGPALNDIKNGFENMSAKSRMALVGYLLPQIRETDIATGIEAIEHRNGMIHEGREVPERADRFVMASILITLALCAGPPHKLPR